MRILFVCTGNTCRSPMAEKLLQKMANDKGLDIEVQSAGLFASQGFAASDHAVRVLRKKGIECTHASQPVTPELLEWADIILTMTESHRHTLWQKYPQYENKVYTLKEYTDLSPETNTRTAELDELYRELERKQEAFLAMNREEISRLEDEYQTLYNQLEQVRERLDDWRDQLMKETVEERNRIAVLEQQTPNYDISDPYGGPLEVYEQCAEEISHSLEQLLRIIEKNVNR
ncbi:low molecular weight protein arginine phosphatase [Aneurinibacillus terranovensis]|uniref:low molecular weight protein arginine phosphatase n=1 Tax=Aneurinibacillus terranovensis TaxID=278991 RepID=UPI0003FAB15B|nr:low molecular weight protein arginine phosphatase [Aneurinibacillus terranovensis]